MFLSSWNVLSAPVSRAMKKEGFLSTYLFSTFKCDEFSLTVNHFSTPYLSFTHIVHSPKFPHAVKFKPCLSPYQEEKLTSTLTRLDDLIPSSVETGAAWALPAALPLLPVGSCSETVSVQPASCLIALWWWWWRRWKIESLMYVSSSQASSTYSLQRPSGYDSLHSVPWETKA